jgi:bacterial/archaeal transporter family-2 protein
MDVVMALLAGAVVPIQAGMNAQLKNVLGTPILAVLVSVVVSTISLLLYSAFMRIPFSGFANWQQAPWWVWLGGVFGAMLLVASATLAPRLGAIALVASIIAGQIICSILLDQFGLLGFKQHSLNLGRAAGIVLLSAGVYLIVRY